MAITVEDGTIVTGAESYVSAATATTYHTNRGNTAWTGADAVKEAALRRAATYLDGRYRLRWKGARVYPLTQAMEWPRAGVETEDGQALDITTIPQRLKDAQCELALRALSGPLADDLNASVRREKVDVLETEYAPGAKPGQIEYQIVDQLLSDLLKPSGSSDLLRG
jgi:hypothetical protein